MSIEICKLCEKESTPWFHINGHICRDCYEKDKWISVKDRLPELDVKVIIYDCKYETIDIAFRTDEGNKELGIVWFYPENNGWTEEEVTHWMQLPESPSIKCHKHDACIYSDQDKCLKDK